MPYNHKFWDIFTQPGSKEMINCLCSVKLCLVLIIDRCRAAPKMINKAEKRLAINGPPR